MPLVTMPDGAVVEMPDTLTGEQAAKLKKINAETAGAKFREPAYNGPKAFGGTGEHELPVKPERGYSTPEYLLDEFKSGASSLASLPGLPIDALTAIYNLGAQQKGLSPIKDPLGGGSQQIKKGWDLITGAKGLQSDPESTPEMLAGGAANFLGQGAFLSAPGIAKTAAAKVAAGLPARGRLASDAATELVSTLGGGAGFRAGEHYGAKLDKENDAQVKWRQALWSLLGGASGGGVSAILGTKAIPEIGRMFNDKIAPVLTKENADIAVKEMMTQQLRGALESDPKSQDTLRKSLETTGDINKGLRGTQEKFQPDLAQATGSAATQELKRRLELETPEAVRKDIERQGANTRALETLQGRAFPETASARRVAGQDVSAANTKINERLKGLIDKEKALRDEIERNGFTAAKGEQLRELAKQQYEDAHNVVKKLYADIDTKARASGFSIPSDPLVQKIRSIEGREQNMFQQGQAKTAFGEIKEALKKGTAGLSWDNYRSLMKHINAGLEKNGNSYEVAFLSELKTEAKKLAAQKDPSIVAEFDKVNESFGQMMDTFVHGAYGEMSKQGEFGYRTFASDIVDSMMKKGEQGAKQYNETFGQMPNAKSLMEDGILDAFSRATIKDGKFSEKAARAFLDKHAAFLDGAAPETKQVLSTWAGAQEAIMQRATRLGKIQDQIADSALAKLAKTPNTGAFLESAAKDYLVAGELAREVRRNPDLARAVGRGYSDIVMKAKNPDAFLLENEGNLKPIFDAFDKPGVKTKHWENLKTLAKGREIQGRTSPEPLYAPKAVIDPIAEKTGTPVSGWFSRIRNSMLYHITSPEWAIVDLGGKWVFKVAQQDAKKAMEKAFYSPELAAELAKAERAVHLPGITKEELNETRQSIVDAFKSHGLRVELNVLESQVNPRAQQDADESIARHKRQGQAVKDRISGRSPWRLPVSGAVQ